MSPEVESPETVAFRELELRLVASPPANVTERLARLSYWRDYKEGPEAAVAEVALVDEAENLAQEFCKTRHDTEVRPDEPRTFYATRYAMHVVGTFDPEQRGMLVTSMLENAQPDTRKTKNASYQVLI